jgi:predicted component of type VI protein secretion system
MGWLLGHGPQLRIMMETFNSQDVQALGLEKVRESSGDGGEKIGDIQVPPKIYHKMPMLLNPTH